MKVSASTLRSLGEDLYWIEGRPELAGRSVVVRWAPNTIPGVISPDALSLGSRVHEYGGGAMAVLDHDGPLIVGVNATDQSIVSFRPNQPSSIVVPGVEGICWGDLSEVPRVGSVLAVREDTRITPVRRSVAMIEVSTGRTSTILEGRDFFAGARVSPDGTQMCWMAWDHPSMPWEAGEVWVAELHRDNQEISIANQRCLAGGLGSPAGHPEFGSDGSLLFALEEGEWAQPVQWRRGGAVTALAAMEREFSGPLWVLGEIQSVERGGRVFWLERSNGSTNLVELAEGSLRGVETGASTISTIVTTPGSVAWMGSTPTALGAVGRIDLATGSSEMVPLGPLVDSSVEWITRPEPVRAMGRDGREIHGLLFVPTASDIGPEPPPVIVFCHGGPTAQARAGFDPTVQVFCSKGFAVLCVNYAGSTGYGATYRHRLEGQWGISDVSDCVEIVEWLGARGVVDAERAAIRGSSAGGLTALLALTSGVFVAGTSWYGVADLPTLAESTHDFESRYLDVLVGPLPESEALYRERSPVTRAHEMRGAVLLLQGLDDPVVPPSQSHSMRDALLANGQAAELIEFPGESHGFRRLETLTMALTAELEHYQQHLCPEEDTLDR